MSPATGTSITNILIYIIEAFGEKKTLSHRVHHRNQDTTEQKMRL